MELYAIGNVSAIILRIIDCVSSVRRRNHAGNSNVNSVQGFSGVLSGASRGMMFVLSMSTDMKVPLSIISWACVHSDCRENEHSGVGGERERGANMSVLLDLLWGHDDSVWYNTIRFPLREKTLEVYTARIREFFPHSRTWYSLIVSQTIRFS